MKLSLGVCDIEHKEFVEILVEWVCHSVSISSPEEIAGVEEGTMVDKMASKGVSSCSAGLLVGCWEETENPDWDIAVPPSAGLVIVSSPSVGWVGDGESYAVFLAYFVQGIFHIFYLGSVDLCIGKHHSGLTR